MMVLKNTSYFVSITVTNTQWRETLINSCYHVIMLVPASFFFPLFIKKSQSTV